MRSTEKHHTGGDAHWARGPMRMDGQGTYHAFKVAVAIICFHFVCRFLVQFADILLPFIMALLLVSVLEPVKQVALSVIEGTFLQLLRTNTFLGCCLRRPRRNSDRFGSMHNHGNYGIRDKTELGELVKRICLFLSIVFTLVFAGRVFWIIGRIVWLSGEAVTHDFQFYQVGVQKRQEQVEHILAKAGLAKKVHLDMNHLAKYALMILKYAAKFLTNHIFYTMSQISLTTIFVVFLLYSPVQRDFSPVMRGVFGSMETYLKLKTLISLGMGVTNGTALAIVGLEIPAAWGLMTFLANFIPNLGGPLMSILPCVIALLDVRKTLFQVCAAFLAQFFLHFTIANFVEPIIFGTTEEIHSVVVILGLSFFGYMWGFTGMFLAVPLLFAIHAWLDTVARTSTYPMEAREDARFIMGMLEGTWLSDSVDTTDPEHTDVNLLTGQIEAMEGPSGAEAASMNAWQSVDSTKTPPPAATWELKELRSLFEVMDRETNEVRFQGLALRWILVFAAYIVLFYFTDPAVLIHPSGGSVEDLSMWGNSRNSTNTTSMANTSTFSSLTTTREFVSTSGSVREFMSTSGSVPAVSAWAAGLHTITSSYEAGPSTTSIAIEVPSTTSKAREVAGAHTITSSYAEGPSTTSKAIEVSQHHDGSEKPHRTHLTTVTPDAAADSHVSDKSETTSTSHVEEPSRRSQETEESRREVPHREV